MHSGVHNCKSRLVVTTGSDHFVALLTTDLKYQRTGFNSKNLMSAK